MSFDYHKHKEHGGNDSFWTSYSDLFLGLSTIFLLLYVTASLRTGTDGIKHQLENQKLTMQVNDLKNQLKMYESIKKDYLQNEAGKGEMQEYRELMDKLSLLQEEAKDEKERLRQAALGNEQKESALNKYQQMVRNIINANKVAKSKIGSRDDIIVEKEQEIEVQDQQISELEQDVNQKKQLIAEGERKIQEANETLDKKMQEIKRAYKQNKISSKIYEKRIASLKQETEEKIENLNEEKSEYQQQLASTQAKIGNLSGQLAATEGKLAQKETETSTLQNKIAGMRGEFEEQKKRDRENFEKELKGLKLSADEKAKKETAYRAAAAQKERDLADKISGLSSQLKDTEGQLAKAKAEMDARKEVAKEIKRGFEKAGIKAEVDMGTGEVLIDFGQAYFDSDSSTLKKEMKSILEKAMPVYSKSLFGNPKVSKKISAVEVVGFASPTYQGKYIDPTSTTPQDREALKYNMDLSYRRAKSIFNYIIDEDKVKFEHQRELLPMMKVSGRSFLEVFKENRSLASGQDFCKVNDCKRAQRVIIRFSMDGKK